MVHATRIKDGVASYSNHLVRTHKLKEEQRAGFPIYAKVGSQGSCVALAACRLAKEHICVLLLVQMEMQVLFLSVGVSLL